MHLRRAQQAWLSDIRGSTKAGTRRWYKRMTDALIEYLAVGEEGETVPMGVLTADNLRAWRSYLRHKPRMVGAADDKYTDGTISISTANSHLRAARRWLNWMIRQEIATADAPVGPVAAWMEWLAAGNRVPHHLPGTLKRFRQQTKQVKAASKAEKKAMLRSAAERSARDRAIVGLFPATGSRLSEIAAIRVSDMAWRLLDQEEQDGEEGQSRDWYSWRQMQLYLTPANRGCWRGKIRIVGKGDKERVVFYGSELAAILFDYLEDERPELLRKGKAYLSRQLRQVPPNKRMRLFERRTIIDDRLFLGQRGPLTSSGVAQVLERVADDADIDNFSAHKWRHGFAVSMLLNGANPRSVADLLGHSSTKVTLDIYGGHTEEQLDDVHRQYGWDQ